MLKTLLFMPEIELSYYKTIIKRSKLFGHLKCQNVEKMVISFLKASRWFVWCFHLVYHPTNDVSLGFPPVMAKKASGLSGTNC
jgi:hypothetical protein